MECWKRKTRDYNQKQNVRVASEIDEQFRTLTIFRNEGLLRLFTCVSIDLMIRGFELELVDLNSKHVDLNS